jgi:GBP family porin
MKRTFLFVMSSLVFATKVHAQSSVTLYGLIDAGVSYTNDVFTHPGVDSASAVRFTSGLLQDNRWGLKGAEDLGEGLKVVFNLESSFSLANGTQSQNGRTINRQFSRNAYVGLSSDTVGTVTLGRQEEFMYDYLSKLSLANYNGASGVGGMAFAHPYENDNLAGSFRVNNSVKYTSVNYNGFTFGGLYGFSNKAGGFHDNSAYSLGASYNNGPIRAALAYTQLNNNKDAGGAVDGSTLENGSQSASADALFTAQRVRIFGGGASYTFDRANVGFVITNTDLGNATNIGPVGNSAGLGVFPNSSMRFTNYEVNGHYRLTSALTLGASYTYTNYSIDSSWLGRSTMKWHQFNLISDYTLSKRTDVYGLVTYQLGAGATGEEGTPVMTYGGGMSSGKQVVVGFGLRTRF